MARLVIGNDKTNGVPAIVKKVSEVPNYIAPKGNVNGVYQPLNTATTFDLNGATTISTNSLARGFYNCTNLLSITGLDAITKIEAGGLNECFYGCTGITQEISFDNLKRIDVSDSLTSAFRETGIIGCSFPVLEYIYASNTFYSTFYSCQNLEYGNLPRLAIINGYSVSGKMSFCFFRCVKLREFKFYSLKTIKDTSNALNSCFGQCTLLSNLYFYAVKNDTFGNANTLTNIVNSVDGCTIHFPKNLDPQTGVTTISSLSGYPNFGGTNTIIAFDLPSTVILTGANTTEYERNPAYDTQTALAWRVKDTGTTSSPVIDWTPFYTSGTSDPTVGTTIYSDSSCTTAVTTVASIA